MNANELNATCHRFSRFLGDNGVIRKFVNQLQLKSRYRGHNFRDSLVIRDYSERTEPGKYIISACAWVDSPEGVQFWRELHFEWKKLLENNMATTAGCRSIW